MRVLALDTTTRAGSAALVEDDRVVEVRRGDDARTHALRMPGEIVALADAHQWPLSTIDLYGVAESEEAAILYERTMTRVWPPSLAGVSSACRRSRRWRTPEVSICLTVT